MKGTIIWNSLLNMIYMMDRTMSMMGGTFANGWLTIVGRSPLDNRLGYFPFDLLEEFSTSLQGSRGPEPLIRVDSA